MWFHPGPSWLHICFGSCGCCPGCCSADGDPKAWSGWPVSPPWPVDGFQCPSWQRQWGLCGLSPGRAPTAGVWLGLGAGQGAHIAPSAPQAGGLNAAVLVSSRGQYRVGGAPAGGPLQGAPLWSESDCGLGFPDVPAAQMRKLRPGRGPGSPCHQIWACGKEEAQSKDVRRGLAVSSEVGAGAEARRAGSGQAGRGLLWAHRPGVSAALRCALRLPLPRAWFTHS